MSTDDEITKYQDTGKVLSTSANWLRQYKILIYEHSTKAVQYNASDNSEWDQEKSGDQVLEIASSDPGILYGGLRCTFKIQRYAMYYPNTALITIYNCTAETESKIILDGYRVVVEAGYNNTSGNNYGQIFDGIILDCNRWKQNGTDYILQILALDGEQFINEGYCSFNFAKGQTLRDVTEGIRTRAAAPAGYGYYSPVLDTIPLQKGMAVHGLGKNTLSDIAKSINGTWFVDNGKLYVVAYADKASTLPMGLEAIECSEKTGLIGNPQQQQQCISLQMLLNPQVAPYSLIHIKNELITEGLVNIQSFSEGITTKWALDPEGVYRVISVTFQGDTRGNDWFANITAVTQAGNIPEMLTDTMN